MLLSASVCVIVQFANKWLDRTDSQIGHEFMSHVCVCQYCGLNQWNNLRVAHMTISKDTYSKMFSGWFILFLMTSI